ncbi:MAG: hypothetical protein KME23_16055 [Goleter apudmare HA4340-LM2]|jgi:hypothetical protein|nr:hypothetical protein [Goleter apudmare HA4340-LM2]
MSRQITIEVSDSLFQKLEMDCKLNDHTVNEIVNLCLRLRYEDEFLIRRLRKKLVNNNQVSDEYYKFYAEFNETFQK